jgi:DNA-binding beta-propeller fold protein YncE
MPFRVPIRLPKRPPRWALFGVPLLALAALVPFLPAGTPATAALPPAERPGAVTPVTPSFVQIIPVQSRPVGVGVDPAYNSIYVSHNDVGTGLVRIDGNTNSVNGNFGGLSSGQDLSVNRTAHKVYVGNDGQTYVTIYDAANPNNFTQVNVGASAPFGSASYEAVARTYIMIHQDGKIATLDSNFNNLVSFDATYQSGFNPGNPILAAVDPATAVGPRLYVTHFNPGSSWGLESFDLSNPSQPSLVYLLQYDSCGRNSADSYGVAFNPTNHDIYVTYNGAASSCVPDKGSGYVSRFDQRGQNPLRYEFPNVSVGNLIYIPETNRLWVIQKADPGLVWVLDAATMSPVTGPMQVGTLGGLSGTGPERGIAYNPNTGLVYVASLRSNEVTVFRDFQVTTGATATPTFTATALATATPTATATPRPLCPPGSIQPSNNPRQLFLPVIAGGVCRP